MTYNLQGLAALLAFPGLNFATTPSAVTGAAGGASGDGGGAGAGGAGGGTAGGGAPAASAAPATSGQPPQDFSGNIAQLRTAYENLKRDNDTLKQQYEPWSKLQNVKPDDVGRFQGVYENVYGEMTTLAETLGYSEQDLSEVLGEFGAVQVLDFLRNEMYEQEGQQQQPGQRDVPLEDMIQQRIDQALGPIQRQENVRRTNDANALFERTTHGLAAEHFKTEGIDIGKVSQDELQMLMTATSELLKYDEGAVRDLKYKGVTAGIQKAFKDAVRYLDGYYIARASRDRGAVVRPGQPNAQQQQQPNKKLTLEDMAENPALINAKYA